MLQARKLLIPALSLVMAIAISACGMSPQGSPTALYQSNSGAIDTSAQDFTDEEALKASELNQSGDLDSKEFGEFETALGRTATTLSTAERQTAGLFDSPAGGYFSVKRATKIGYVRSIEDGKYMLTLKKETTQISVTGSDGKRDRRIEGYLNRKVVLRGIVMANGQLMVEHIITIPTFKSVTDLFFKGRLAGTVYIASNKQGLVGALVVAKAGSTGYLYRTQTDRTGNFQFSGLEPDTYSLTVGLGGFKGASQTGLGVLKGKKTSLMIPMTPAN
ncbi:carboxypeptidase regulatory-like domain-containing protein [bacterium]|nr:carboxypeptidase regulatory-like domain-containing protein [bacterium]